mgnify:CR=1 FL=1
MAAETTSEVVIESFNPDLSADAKTIKALTLQSLKRTYEVFASNYGQPVPLDETRSAIEGL